MPMFSFPSSLFSADCTAPGGITFYGPAKWSTAALKIRESFTFNNEKVHEFFKRATEFHLRNHLATWLYPRSN